MIEGKQKREISSQELCMSLVNFVDMLKSFNLANWDVKTDV